MKQKLTIKNHTDSFFRELFRRCRQEDTYSVIETAKKMGVDYETVKKWATQKEKWAYVLQLCRETCADHAEVNGLLGKIPDEESLKYLFECGDEWLALYPTQEAQQELIKSAIANK
jgi:hypothetical protein